MCAAASGPGQLDCGVPASLPVLMCAWCCGRLAWWQHMCSLRAGLGADGGVWVGTAARSAPPAPPPLTGTVQGFDTLPGISPACLLPTPVPLQPVSLILPCAPHTLPAAARPLCSNTTSPSTARRCRGWPRPQVDSPCTPCFLSSYMCAVGLQGGRWCRAAPASS